MTSDDALQTMQRYFAGKAPPEVLERFDETPARNLLKESLDVVDFIVYLEEESGREVDIQEVGEALVGMTFRELADYIARVASQPAG